MNEIIIIVIALAALWALANQIGQRVMNPMAQAHEKHLNRIDPDGLMAESFERNGGVVRGAHDPEHPAPKTGKLGKLVQRYSGPGCGYCCTVIYWYGIPIGSSCVFVCNSGHG